MNKSIDIEKDRLLAITSTIIAKADKREIVERMTTRTFNRMLPAYRKAVDEWMDFLIRQINSDIRKKFSKAGGYKIATKFTDWDFIEEKGKTILKPATLDVMAESGQDSFKVMSVEGSFDVFNPRSVAIADKIVGNAIQGITKETRKAIAYSIGEGIKEGRGMAQVAKNIRGVVGLNERQARAVHTYKGHLDKKRPDLSSAQKMKKTDAYSRKLHRQRADLIARTETARAQSEGTLEGYTEAGIERVEFLAAAGCCPICDDLNGQRFDIAEASGMIPAHPACRCTWLNVVGRKKPVPLLEKPRHLGVGDIGERGKLAEGIKDVKGLEGIATRAALGDFRRKVAVVLNPKTKKIAAAASYAQEGKNMMVWELGSTGTVPGAGTKVFREVANVASRAKLGMQVDAIPTARSFYAKLGMKPMTGKPNLYRFTTAETKTFAGGKIVPKPIPIDITSDKYITPGTIEHEKWTKTIHGSKYWNAEVKRPGYSNSPFIQLRFSNHLSNGDFYPDLADRDLFIKVTDEIYYQKEYYNFYSKKWLNQDTVIKAMEKNLEVMEEISDSIKFQHRYLVRTGLIKEPAK